MKCGVEDRRGLRRIYKQGEGSLVKFSYVFLGGYKLYFFCSTFSKNLEASRMIVQHYERLIIPLFVALIQLDIARIN